jgi:hypothetical protein
MTLKIDSFGSIIDSFLSTTQIADTVNFSHSISFSSGRAIKNTNTILPEIVYSGSKISKNISSGDISTGDSYLAYANYEKIKIVSTPKGMTGLTSDSVNQIYVLDGLTNQPGNNSTVSYDVFDKIDPNYSPDDLEFRISLTSSYELAVVFAKAPPINKIEYPEMFNSSTHSDSSFWDYSASNLTEVCASDRFNSGDRIVYLRLYKHGVIQPTFTSGDFKKFTTISLGTDGRYALKSEIIDYLVSNSVQLTPDSNGYVYNELIYPPKSENTVININGINVNNKLTIQLSLVFSARANQVAASIQISDGLSSIQLASDSIILPICALTSIFSTLSVSSKNSTPDITVSAIETYLGTTSTTADPIFGNRYESPKIYTYISPSTYLDSSSGEVSMVFGDALLIKALPVYSGISTSQIYSSLDNAPFTNTYQATLTGDAKYGTHVLRSYIAASGGVNQSLVTEKIIVVHPIIPTPVFTSSTAGGILTISATSDFDIFYSTDGQSPDLTSRSNVALYTRSFKIKKKTIIKAVAVYGGYSSSVVEYVFDPDVSFTTPATLPTITLTGTQTSGIYSGIVTVTLGSITGVAYYTLDGSNPLDPENISRRVYVAPFKILPIANQVINLYVATVRDGYRSISNYPSTPRVVKFNFICNPWKISDSTLDASTAVVTSTGNLQVNSGAILERSKAISGDFYYQFNTVNVSGNGSLVFGMKSYLNLVNNLSEGEYTRKWPSPAITFIDKVGDVITCNVGYRYGLNDKNNFDAVGKFDWNVTTPLPVTVFVKDEINVPVGSLLYDANELTSRIAFTSDVNLDNMFGLTLNMANSIVVSNISSHSSRLIKLPNPSTYATGTKITITKHGHTEASKLIIGCENNITIGTSTVLSLTIEDNSSLVVTKDVSGVWVAVSVTNLTAYTNTKKMKIQVNGLETDYVPVSSKELDYVMFTFAEVNGEGSAYVEIDKISGGCL